MTKSGSHFKYVLRKSDYRRSSLVLHKIARTGVNLLAAEKAKALDLLAKLFLSLSAGKASQEKAEVQKIHPDNCRV